jgi:hypothetical protein
LQYAQKENLLVYHQNIRGLSQKTEELIISLNIAHSPHILCLTEHHLKAPDILQLNLENYLLGKGFCRKNLTKGGVSIFVKRKFKI